jgi:Ni,Fe-hydrogenase III large subunit
MMALGGVRRDIKPEHVPLILRTMKETKNVKKLIDMVMEDRVTKARLEGVGVLTKEDARRYCVVGPTARGRDCR